VCSLTCTGSIDQQLTAPIEVQLFNSISAINENTWQRFVPANNPLLQPEYLQLIERTQNTDLEFIYAVLRQGDITVGVAYFQVVTFKGAQLVKYIPENLRALLKAIVTPFLKSVNWKMLVSGNLFMTGDNGLHFASALEPATKAALLRKTVSEILSANKSIKGVLVPDMYAPKTAFDEGWECCSYHHIDVEADMSFTINPEWKKFDDYLNALSSKYRVRTKKVMALCAENHVEEKDLSIEEIIENTDTIYGLYMQVMEKVDFKLAELSKQYFAEQKKQMPHNYKVFGYFKDGEMIGFISLFHFGKRIEVHYTGMKHEATKPIHLYQHMMYDIIKYGIENKVEKLHFGRTAAEIKSTIGATPNPMYGYIKHRNYLVNLILKPLAARLRPKEYVIRNPFK
jgi:hypothetical protein